MTNSRRLLLGLAASLALLGVPAEPLTAGFQDPAPAAREAQVWAILIGVGNYADPSLPDQPTARDQAGAMLRWFRSTGWPDDHQLLLTDFGNQNPGEPEAPAADILPTASNLNWAVNQWLLPRAKAGDLVVFYFAGQTSQVVTSPARAEPKIEHYLMPINAVAADAARTGWSLDGAVDQCALRRIRVACWLETSAGITAPANPARDGLQIQGGRHWLRRLTRWPGVTAWLASNRPMPPDPSGTFTRALIDGLGTPDSQPNLAATLKGLEQDSKLSVRGFQSMGRVPPDLNLWRDEFNRVIVPPRPEMVLQVGHADKITSLACSADHRMLFSGSLDSTVRAWSLADGSLLKIWTGQTVGATALGLTGDDRWLAMGGGRGTVAAADLASFDVTPFTRAPHVKRVDAIAMLPDGDHFVSIDRDGNANLGDLRTSPMDPQPWPDESLRCKEVVSGGKAGDGTVAGLFTDGSIRLFDAHGAGGAVITPAQGKPTTLAISPDGQSLVIGFETGRLVIRDVRKGTEAVIQAADQPIRRLAVSRSGEVAIGLDKGLRLLASGDDAGNDNDGQAKLFDLADRPASSLALAANGRYLAASLAGTGAVKAWRLDGPRPPQPIYEDAAAEASVVALTSDGRVLIVGGLQGKLSTRLIEQEAPGEVAASKSWTVPANSGKVVWLQSSPSRNSLLVITDAKRAQLWDLKNRTCRLLPGRWTSGVFLSSKDDGDLILTAAADAPEHPGAVIRLRYDRERARVELTPEFFARAADGFTLPDLLAFDQLTLSPDGSRLAATAHPSQPPLLCVWDVKTGKLTHWTNHVDDPIQSLSFSADGARLLTAGNSPVARLWNLADRPGEMLAAEVAFSDPRASTFQITGAAIRPGRDQIVTGHSDGTASLWSWKNGVPALEVPRLVEGALAGAVRAIAFPDEGRKLAVAGDGTRIWLGALDDPPHAIDDLDTLAPHHFEQINGMTAWDAPPMLITASDDTTVRFWDLNRKSLWATLSTAATADAEIKGERVQPLDWVLYTPDGFFDASAGGQKLVRFRRGDAANPLEQFEETHFRFRLGDDLLAGLAPPAIPPLQEPQPISILEPARPDSSIGDTELTVTLTDADWTDVVLYHNDRPIPTGLPPGTKPFPSQFTVKTKLVKGINRFAVMGSREGALNSLSEPLELAYDGPVEPSRIHVVAMGIGRYNLRQLKYPERDASRLSEELYARGLDDAGTRGTRIFLSDTEVTPAKIEQAFDEIAAKVEDRPQDKVVVFLAGHTGVFNSNRFCLLLPGYQFPANEPYLASARGAAPDQGARNKELDPNAVLPYATVAANMIRLKALDRLIIVDACQAESILEDPQVVEIQKWIELGSRKVRTSYLMAARRGEPAIEVDPLGHGLFTYTLLRGMGAIDPGNDPEEIVKLNLPGNADFNGDGVLSTTELNQYITEHLDEIAGTYPTMIASRQAVLPASEASKPAESLVQRPMLQSFGDPFPLVPLTARSVRQDR